MWKLDLRKYTNYLPNECVKVKNLNCIIYNSNIIEYFM